MCRALDWYPLILTISVPPSWFMVPESFTTGGSAMEARICIAAYGVYGIATAEVS
jgi:hypothetical protein